MVRAGRLRAAADDAGDCSLVARYHVGSAGPDVLARGGFWFFVRGLETDRRRFFWAAFGLAGAAFLCRVTTAGVLPGWFLYGALRYRPRKLLSGRILVPASLYLGAAIAWTLFAARFGRYEVGADGRGSLLSATNWTYFVDCLPALALWGSFLLGLAGAAWALCRDRGDPAGLFWLTWLAGYSAFKLLTPTTSEVRHFFMAMPAFAGLAAYLFARWPLLRDYRPAAALVLLAGIVLNAVQLRQIPSGVVGYAEVGRCLAEQSDPGNILLTCPEDQELIFRFRASKPRASRQLVRGDRVLAIRLPEYAAIAPQPLAHSEADVLDIIRQGRIRYLVTSCPNHYPDDAGPRKWPLPTMSLARRRNNSSSWVNFPCTFTTAARCGAARSSSGASPSLCPKAAASFRSSSPRPG